MINEEKVIITNDIDIGATIAYKDKKEKRPFVIITFSSLIILFLSFNLSIIYFLKK